MNKGVETEIPGTARARPKMSGEREQEQDDIDHWPEGVEAIFGSGADATYVLAPWARKVRWPGLIIDSASFKKLPRPERLYQLSRAYLHSRIVLCEHAGDTGIKHGWPQACVCYYCLHLAIELFLKACILRVGGEPSKSHDVAELRREYDRLLPGKAFSFETPWALSAKDLAKIAGGDVLHGVDRTPDQLYRYGMDKGGVPSSAKYQGFVPGVLFNYMSDLEDRWRKIWEKVQASNEG